MSVVVVAIAVPPPNVVVVADTRGTVLITILCAESDVVADYTVGRTTGQGGLSLTNVVSQELEVGVHREAS